MNTSLNNGIRQAHRWLSIAFTLSVIANFIARAQGEPTAWLTYAPLLPLALLLLSGLYLFVLPYLNKWRTRKAQPAV
ncbi:hypothetical protein CAI21_17355 [Alkalilimnicola ehrlichii]|uniref:Uncharacterized protein n=1 Tax=Alkalilimnicola ehrlichii TaxID=351052 RepID=A0A3E0WM54_9GAMM|nr:hypothetical protein [Alkalilimnicola ehrlichii]RFA26246.1 hypothetical protein CAI21_17355 [Alkalilimnicola ehrlichii]RFA33231.1 hypothetical protein CAL65_17840 [Alkalilimnicola ehrlichii]